MPRELVVPCFNEARRLRLEAFRTFVDAQSGWKLLMVDDGSRDDTWAQLESLRASRPDRVRTLRLHRNQGKAEAVRSGVVAAIDRGARIVGYWDADLATPLAAVEQFELVLEKDSELDFVLGARVQLLGRDIRRDSRRHYGGRVFASLASMVLRLPVYDTQCGAKLFRVRPWTRDVFSKPFRSQWVFDVELLQRWCRSRLARGLELDGAFFEFPVDTWVDVPGSKVGMSDVLRAAWDLARLELERRRGEASE